MAHARGTAFTARALLLSGLVPAIPVSCSAQAANQVTVVAVDMATHETNAGVVQGLSTPMALANAQLAAAKTTQQVTSAQAAVVAARATMLANAAAC